MRKIVFVCSGNTCRSPMAEGLFRVLAEKYGLKDVECTSCGLSACPGVPASPYAVSAVAPYGADISKHRSRPITQELLEQGDLFVCMTEWHARQLAPYLPKEKICVLGDGIPDPYDQEREEYEENAALIYAELEAWIRKGQEGKA